MSLSQLESIFRNFLSIFLRSLVRIFLRKMSLPDSSSLLAVAAAARAAAAAAVLVRLRPFPFDDDAVVASAPLAMPLLCADDALVAIAARLLTPRARLALTLVFELLDAPLPPPLTNAVKCFLFNFSNTFSCKASYSSRFG